MSEPQNYYDLPWGPDVAGTVFDSTDDTFGPIMAAIQAGDFEEAIGRLLLLTEGGDRRKRTDFEALAELNLLLSAPEWPGASGMEDVCEIVRSTGRAEVPNAPEWERH